MKCINQRYWGTMGVGRVPWEVGGSWCAGLCDIMRRMHEFNCFILVGIFLKTMQLPGTTVTKIFRMTHKYCGHFNLYWSWDAVSALTCTTSGTGRYQRFGTKGTMLLGAFPETSAHQDSAEMRLPTFDIWCQFATCVWCRIRPCVFGWAPGGCCVRCLPWIVRSSHFARIAQGQMELSFCALPHMMPAIQPGRGARAAASHDDIVMTHTLLRKFKKWGISSRDIRFCLSMCPGLNNLVVNVPTAHDSASDCSTFT